MDTTANPAEVALARLLSPRSGTVSCGVPEEVTLALYGEACHWTGTSAKSAGRHRDARALAAEVAAGNAPKGRGRNVGHNHVSARRAVQRERERAAIGSVRASALIADVEDGLA